MLRVSRWAGPLAILALCIGFYWKLALTDQYVWFDHPDMCYLEIPRLQFQAAEIHRGQFPLWDPRIWLGQPLIGQTQPGPLYPFNLLFAALPLADGYIKQSSLNWYFVFAHCQAALFCYLLARDLGRSKGASILAACVFSFGGFVGTAAWIDVLNGAVWTPLVAMFLLRALRGQSPVANAILSGFFLGVAWLCGHHEIPMLVSYSALFAWGFQLWKNGWRENWKPALLFFVTLFLTSAAQTIPTYEFGKISRRWLGLEDSVGWKDPIPYIAQTIYSLPVRGILGLALFGVNQADASPFIGIGALGFGALGMLTNWRKDVRVRWFAAFTGFSLIYALGAHTPLQGWFYSFAPMLGKARVPIRTLHLVHFGIAMLAAWGLDALLDRISEEWTRRVRWALLGFGALILSAEAARIVMSMTESGESTLLTAWMAVALAALFAAYARDAISRNMAAVIAVAIVMIDLTSLQQYPHRLDKDKNKFVKSLAENRDIGAYLKSQPWPVRVAVNDNDIPMNFGDWHGVDMLQGYVAGAPENLLRNGMHSPPLHRLYNVQYWISKEPQRPDQELVFTGASGVKVFKNTGTMPRAWVSHAVVRMESQGHLQLKIGDEGFSPRSAALVTDPGVPEFPAACNAEEEVKIIRHHANRITLQTDLQCRGMVTVADTHYTGWQATVDGKPASIVETYGALRGIDVGPGKHEIELRFRPLSVYGGGALTLAGVILAAVAWRRRQ
jgi:hypothetical protein